MKTIVSYILTFFILSLVSGKSHEILFPAKKDGLWGFIDISGDWAIKPQFFKAMPFHEGLAAVRELNRWGYVNMDGEWVIEPEYEMASSFEEGLAGVVYQNRWGFINRDGQVIIPFKFEKASSFSEGLAVVSKNEHYQFIDHLGNVILDGAFSNATPFAEGLAKVEWGDKKGYINDRGHVVLSRRQISGTFSEGFAKIKIQSKWGFIDRAGNMVIEPKFKSAGRFKNGMASAKRKESWGMIDRSGAWVIDPQFEILKPFYQGYAVARSSNYWGVIDESGEWVIPAKFDGLDHAGKSVSLQNELKEHVLAAFSSWKLKGEFEKRSSYEKRMVAESQSRAMDSLFQIEVKKHGDAMISSGTLSLGYYNADLETFTFYVPGTLPSSIHVPIEDAPRFKENWDYARIDNANYGFAGEYFVLKDYSISILGKTYDKIVTGQTIATAAGWVDEVFVPEIQWNEEKTIYQTISKVKPGTSDVDRDIPKTNFVNTNTFALIIGNEDYKSFQGGLNSEINVSYAVIDAEIFSKYAHQTLGIPTKNITLIKNGTAGQMKQAFAKMNKIAKAFDGKAEFIFYYAGHGLPDEISKKPYLIPVDVNGSDLSFAISLDEALNTLSEHPHTRITVFLDACFTGGGRKENLIASRGVKIRPKSPFVKGNLIMFSASSGNQSAFAYDEKAHGMFTYFLLKKLQESEGKISYSELENYLEHQVAQNAVIHNNKEQTPELLVSPSLQEDWKEFNLLTPYTGAISRK